MVSISLALGVDGEHGAAIDGLAVHDDGAGAAGAAVADALGAGQAEPVAQGVEQRDARLDRELVRLAIDLESDRHRTGTHYGRGALAVCALFENTGAQSSAEAHSPDKAAPGDARFGLGLRFSWFF